MSTPWIRLLPRGVRVAVGSSVKKDGGVSPPHPAIRTGGRPCQARSGGPLRFLKSISHLARRAARNGLLRATELEYRFQRFVIQAAGTYVMQRLSIAGRFFYAKGESSGVFLDQLVALNLACLFFKLAHPVFKVVYASQRRALALGGLNAILLHGEYLSPEMCQLSRQFIGGRRDLRFIERLYGSPMRVDGLSESGSQGHQVHEGSPGVDEGGVVTPDSTFGGNQTGAQP